MDQSKHTGKIVNLDWILSSVQVVGEKEGRFRFDILSLVGSSLIFGSLDVKYGQHLPCVHFKHTDVVYAYWKSS